MDKAFEEKQLIMRRIVPRMLPDGSIKLVQPYHVSMEGLEKEILCRDDEDYDAFVKILCVCALRKNVILIIYAVVSNHCHSAILSASHQEAKDYGEEIKRIYSMWFRRKYGIEGGLRKVDVQAIYIDTDWYLRNALAYIPRNAMDNGCKISEYHWSGYNAMFSGDSAGGSGWRKVSSMTKRERRKIMHTADDLSGVPWIVDGNDWLVPKSICDHAYLEQAFENDQAFFLKTIGGQNSAEMYFKLVEAPRKRLTDNDFMKIVEETSQRWFQSPLSNISLERKIRLIPYVARTSKTSVSQLARVFGIDRETVHEILGRVGMKP